MDAELAVQEKEGLLKKEALESNIGLEDRRKSLVALAAENAKAEADARAYGVSSTMKALGTADSRILQALASTGMKPEQLIAFAFHELAGKADKIVLVTRHTRLAELVARFNTVSQARFYVEHQGADFQDYLQEDKTYHRAL